MKRMQPPLLPFRLGKEDTTVVMEVFLKYCVNSFAQINEFDISCFFYDWSVAPKLKVIQWSIQQEVYIIA